MQAAVKTGFTLIELIVVIILIAVLAGLTAPQLMGSWETAALRESAKRLHRAAQYARAYAVTRGQTVRLTLNTEQNTYQLQRQTTDDAGAVSFESVEGALHRTQSLAETVRFERVQIQPRQRRAGASRSRREEAEQASTVTFTPRGEADAALIEIADDRRSWTVRINPSTGRAELREGSSTEMPRDRIDLDA